MRAAVFFIFLFASGLFHCYASDQDSELNVDDLLKSVAEAEEVVKRLGPLTEAQVEQAIPRIATLKYPTDLAVVCEGIGIHRAYLWGRCYYSDIAGFKWVRLELTDTYCILFKSQALDLKTLFDVRIERRDTLKDLTDFTAIESQYQPGR